MPIVPQHDQSIEADLSGAGATNPPIKGWFALSAATHVLILLALLAAAAGDGTLGVHAGMRTLPIDVEIVSATSQQGDSIAAASPAEVSPPVAQDQLEPKLEALAQESLPEQAQPRSSAAQTNGAATQGGFGQSKLEDFITAEIERRWNLDVASLRAADVSVPIKVEITKEGVVKKAEIAQSAHVTDPTFDEIAISARNAVLLASPLTLPEGHYRDVMELTLNLNPHDALR